MLPPMDILVIIIYVILILMDIIGNSLLIYIILSCPKRERKPRDMIVLNMSIADLMVGIFFFPRHLLRHAFSHPAGNVGDILCKLVTGGNLAWIGATASSFSIVVLSFERFFAVIYPFKQRFTVNKVKLTVIVCWIYAFVFMTPLFLVLKIDPKINSCVENWTDLTAASAFSTLTLIFLLIIPLVLMSYLYGRVIKRLWFKKNNSTVQPMATTQNFAVKSRKSVTKMLLIVTLIYVICWSSDLILYHILASQWNSADPVYSLPEALVLLNSSVNPVVFSLCSQRFRKQFFRILRREKPSSTGVLTGGKAADSNTDGQGAVAISYPLEGNETNTYN